MTPPAALSEEQFVWFRDLIEQRCGLHIDESQKKSFQSSLWARMEETGENEFVYYYQRLRADRSEEEFRELINHLTVNETYFFRDPAQFQVLRSRILPALLAERSTENNRRVRIWSAGCSTGEEPYSIALLLHETGAFALRDWTFEIVATDVNTEALESARRGVYSRRSVRNVEARLLGRYFTPDGDRFRLNEEVKQSIEFRYLNLMQESFPPDDLRGQDIIFCKNVAIYFSRDTTRRLMAAFFEMMKEGGHLFLGHSESLWQISDDLRLVEYDGSFCYRKPTAAPRGVERRSGRDRRAGTTPPAGIERRLGDRRQLAFSTPREASSTPPHHARIHYLAEKEGAGAGSPASDRTAGEYDECLEAFRTGAWERAEASLKALIQSSPTFIRAHILLSVLYANRSHHDEAIDEARRALEVDPLEAQAHLLVGMIESRRGREEAAVEALRRALYLDSSLLLAHFYLGNLYRSRGDSELAAREYEAVVRSYERHALEWPDEFAVDLTLEQVVQFCRRSVQALRSANDACNGRVTYHGRHSEI